jgi:cytochrome c2
MRNWPENRLHEGDRHPTAATRNLSRRGAFAHSRQVKALSFRASGGISQACLRACQGEEAARPDSVAPRYSVIGLAFLALTGCSQSRELVQIVGDPVQGEIVITRQACGSCHRIPGIQQADGMVGPPLAHFAGRQMIVGRLPNTPHSLELYLRSPQSISKGNAMPDMGLTTKQTRDVAAYLYTLH